MLHVNYISNFKYWGKNTKLFKNIYFCELLNIVSSCYLNFYSTYVANR